MKYWRGYLVAAIAAACAWGLRQFAEAHTVLVDMIYPYVTRMIQDYLAGWSADAAFCIWQLLLLVLGVLVLASIVLMIIFKWNPIQWFGWITAAASLIFLLHTGIYGLNEFSGPLSDDIRLNGADDKYTFTELERAAAYYRDQANTLAAQIDRNANGDPQLPSFQTLAEQAGDGFKVLTYDDHTAVFAGSAVPVKELGWSDFFSSRGVAGMTVAITGEAAVNPQIPAFYQPFAMCHEMAHRMCIAADADADMAAFLACKSNPSIAFQYAAYFKAYRNCYDAIQSVASETTNDVLQRLQAGETSLLKRDLETYRAFFGQYVDSMENSKFCDLLVVWHIQQIVLPQQVVVEEDIFDPKDPNDVDLSGIVNAKPRE